MTSDIRKQFTVLEHNPEYAYFDSGASTLTPDSVMSIANEYYSSYRANIHRGMYPHSERASEMYEDVRRVCATFFGCESNEIFFTSGTTDGINKIAYGLEHILRKDDVILLTELEHHANLIPWQMLAKRTGAVLRFIPIDHTTFALDTDIEKYFDSKVKIVSVAHISNTLGTIQDVQHIAEFAHSVGALCIVDAAQSVAHMRVDVREMDCDFLVCSGHKMYGPTGTGVVYGRSSALQLLQPSVFGGDMIETVDFVQSTWADIPHRFEAGTPNIGGIIGLGETLRFIEHIGWDHIHAHEVEITAKLVDVLSSCARIIGPSMDIPRSGVVSFVMDGIHPHDIAGFLGERGVAIRAGHHCTMPLMQKLDLTEGAARATIGIYTTDADIDKLHSTLAELQHTFS